MVCEGLFELYGTTSQEFTYYYIQRKKDSFESLSFLEKVFLLMGYSKKLYNVLGVTSV